MPDSLEARRPTMSDRLAAPSGHDAAPPGQHARTGGQPETPNWTMPPAPSMPHSRADPKHAPLRKQIEWFFTAIPRLGRTYRRAKLGARAIEEAFQRIAGLESDVREQNAGSRLDEAFHRLDGEAERLNEAFRRLDGEAERLDEAVGRLDRIEAAVGNDSAGRLHDLGGRIGDLQIQFGQELSDFRTRAEAQIEALQDRLASLAETGAAEQALASRGLTDLGRRLDLIRHGAPAVPPAAAPPEAGLEALLDSFYNRLEARYRGSREEIMRRLVKYLPDVEAAVQRTGGRVLDLGCGRGEWLELLRDRGIAAEGVDLNPVQAEEARTLGLDVREGDACARLAEIPDGSLAMVTAHHLVEHLPFRTVAWIAREALRALAPGGLLLLETPNPASLLVGARSFHMDPTHNRPLPGEVLTTLLDTVGYHPVETRALHPHEKLETFFREKRIDPEIAGLIFGPQDIAVTGTKPALAPSSTGTGA